MRCIDLHGQFWIRTNALPIIPNFHFNCIGLQRYVCTYECVSAGFLKLERVFPHMKTVDERLFF